MIVGDRKLMTRDGKKRQKKLSASQQLAAFAGHVQRVGSAWLLECRQRNRPLWRIALLWTYMYSLQRQRVLLLLNFLNRSIWVHVVRIKEWWVMMTETDWYDAKPFISSVLQTETRTVLVCYDMIGVRYDLVCSSQGSTANLRVICWDFLVASDRTLPG